MRKFALFLAPLMAISFLTNCGGSASKQFNVTINTDEHLSFTTLDGKDLNNTKIKEKQDFTFIMKLKDYTNDTVYKLPTALSIFVGDNTVPLAGNYKINETATILEAIVTIDACVVTDNIRINGKSIPIDYYEINLDCYGVNSDFESDFPYAESSKDYAITFSKKEEYDLPKSNNIFINVDNHDWIILSDESSKQYCSYDEGSSILTIKKTKINSNIIIEVRSPTYQLLNDLSWKEINDYSISGLAPFVFYVGDTKDVISNQKYTVRIIDFNRDELNDTSKKTAGITFEFADCVSDYRVAWNNESGERSTNENFIERSSLNKSLQPNGDIYKIIPDDLMNNYIKEVKKYVEIAKDEKVYVNTEYHTKLFPLSVQEINGDQNTSYAYYKGATDAKRIKGDVYWLRSPGPEENLAYSVSGTGIISSVARVYAPYYVAPAFCI